MDCPIDYRLRARVGGTTDVIMPVLKRFLDPILLR